MAQESKAPPLLYDLSSTMGHSTVHEQFSMTPNVCFVSTLALPDSKAIRSKETLMYSKTSCSIERDSISMSRRRTEGGVGG